MVKFSGNADLQEYQEEVQRMKAGVAASTDGTPAAIDAAWHRRYLEELQQPAAPEATNAA